jgi:hypothetical protein
MRRGAVAGPRWGDVDLDAKVIHVRQAAVVVNYELRLTDVKTANGRRTIDINDDVVRTLQAWRRKQAEERLLLGAAYDDHDLVFARPDGTPTHPELLSRTFDRIVARSGLPRIRFHDVPHTHASLLLKAGVPVKVVSERLGQATRSFTLDVYGWVLSGMRAEAAAVFSRLTTARPVEARAARRDTSPSLGSDLDLCSALGGTRTPNLLIRSHFQGVLAGVGRCLAGAATWGFASRRVPPGPARHASCRTIR